MTASFSEHNYQGFVIQLGGHRKAGLARHKSCVIFSLPVRMTDWNVWPETQQMMQLGGFASTKVYRFQFLNDLHALVQYQHQEIIKKEKPQVKYKNREQLYSARLQKRFLEGQEWWHSTMFHRYMKAKPNELGMESTQLCLAKFCPELLTAVLLGTANLRIPCGEQQN